VPVGAVIPEWGSFNLDPILVNALARLGFVSPTPIQRASLPISVSQYRDVVGAAETGSGKTLAYGLPILQRLLERRRRLGMDVLAPQAAPVALSDAAPASAAAGEDGAGSGALQLVLPDEAGERSRAERTRHKWAYLPALILCPTRELASQVCDHLVALVEGTAVRVASIVGGISLPKQRRILASRPDVLVATPGRLWDLCDGGEDYLSQLNRLQFLVLDEADRLCEKGSFSALDTIVQAIRKPLDKEALARGEATAAPVVDPIGEAVMRAKLEKAQKKIAAMEAAAAAALGGPAAGAAETAVEGAAKSKKKTVRMSVPEGEGKGEGDEADEAEDNVDAGKTVHVIEPPLHYRRQTFLFSATLGTFDSAEAIEEAAKAYALAAAGASSGGIKRKGGNAAGPLRVNKQALQKAKAIISNLSPVEMLMARVGLLGKPAVVRISREQAASSAVAAAAAAAALAIKDAPKKVKKQEEAGTADEDSEGMEEDEEDEEEKDDEDGEKANAPAASEMGLPEGSAKVALPPGLRLARMTCVKGEKDQNLYYFLLRFPGRTLIFVNAISTLRRVAALLTSLHLPVHTLHANMQQRQRFQHLEKFRSDPAGILVATDVAARGLDIPLVQFVVHYAMPHTTEVFVHRCGRTARAQTAGLALSLVGPEDHKSYAKIIFNHFGMENGLPEFPVDDRFMRRVVSRVSLARKIAEETMALDKSSYEKNWIMKTAEDAGIVVDEEVAREYHLHGDSEDNELENGEGASGRISNKRKGGKKKKMARNDAAASTTKGDVVFDDNGTSNPRFGDKARKRNLTSLRQQLDAMLSETLMPSGTSRKYVTSNALMGQEAHPLQVRLKLVNPEDDFAARQEDGDEAGAAVSGPQRRGNALVAPKVVLPGADALESTRRGQVITADRSDALTVLRQKGKNVFTVQKQKQAAEGRLKRLAKKKAKFENTKKRFARR
jgi:ATP-dependent RNA helicase DDX24/MAK5